MVKYGVFYARFQPFTKGHLDACLQILEGHDELVIGISNPFRESFEFSPVVSKEGMALKKESLLPGNNPFSYWQRLMMMQASLLGARVDLSRVSIVAKPPTFALNAVWHDSLPPRESCVIYLQFDHKHHFENARIHQQERWRLVDLGRVEDYSGSESLSMLKQGNWNGAGKLMPKPAVKLARQFLNPARAEKSKPKYGIFYGRFQPFHKAQLQHCMSVLKTHDFLVAGVTNPFREGIKFNDTVADSGRASKMESLQPENNPFSFWERYTMVRNSLLEEGVKPKRFCIVAKPSTLSDSLAWLEAFPPREESEVYLPVKDPHHFDSAAVYRKLGWKVVLAAPIDGYSGTLARRLMREEKWKELGTLVPPATLKVMKEVARSG
ncbi:adenylyltransferase/cytidyltransferase family protein [Candidatus Micrarchaeota archaeon]|nr:adenylyltransferase/cytidyltransferase family protein [Candidatus Micrarchaeota archaeon]